MHTEAYVTLTKFANAQRRAGESEAQAFSRYIQTPEGRELFKQHQQERLGDLGASVPAPVAKSAPPATAWNALVAGIQQMSKCSLSKAIEAALTTTAGQEAFAAQKRDELIKSGISVADLTTYDSIQDVRKYHRDFHKANTKPLFMQMVDDVRSRNPSMTMTAAMDHVRSIKPEGEAAWLKFRTLGLENDPQGGAISGRPPPDRSPLWEGEQTSSHLTPPRKFPVADDTVTFKSASETWQQIVSEFRKASGWDWARAVSVLKHHPASCQYYSAMVRENSHASP
jgi:hypothetical protein